MQSNLHETKSEFFHYQELADIEDIVPLENANSMFLGVARALIYMSYNNEKMIKALQTCCSIQRSDLTTDIQLQEVLRLKLCEFLLSSAIDFDPITRMPFLRAGYSECFHDNIFDFLIQLYQLGVNNYSSNYLFAKFAFGAMSKMLKMNVCLKKSNGTWKHYEPNKAERSPLLQRTTSSDTASSSKAGKSTEYKDLEKYLNGLIVYLYEFRTPCTKLRRKSMNNRSTESKNLALDSSDESASIQLNSRIFKLLLNSRVWKANHRINWFVLARFSQFTDPNDVKQFNQHRALLEPTKLVALFKDVLQSARWRDTSLACHIRIFSAFVLNVPVDLLISCERNKNFVAGKGKNRCYSGDILFEQILFTNECNTIGKQLVKFLEAKQECTELSSNDMAMAFLNLLLGKQTFSAQFVHQSLEQFLLN